MHENGMKSKVTIEAARLFSVSNQLFCQTIFSYNKRRKKILLVYNCAYWTFALNWLLVELISILSVGAYMTPDPLETSDMGSRGNAWRGSPESPAAW